MKEKSGTGPKLGRAESSAAKGQDKKITTSLGGTGALLKTEIVSQKANGKVQDVQAKVAEVTPSAKEQENERKAQAAAKLYWEELAAQAMEEKVWLKAAANDAVEEKNEEPKASRLAVLTNTAAASVPLNEIVDFTEGQAQETPANDINTEPEAEIIEEHSVLKPLKLKESEIEAFLTDYLQKLPALLKDSYANIPELIKRTQSSPESYWMIPTEGTTFEGLIVFYIDHTFELKRATVLHASTVDMANVSKFIGMVIEYIWANVECAEIRAELRYIQKEGDFAPYDALKDAYCKDNGFRWKTLLNDTTKGYEQRTLVLGIARPSEAIFLNPR